MNTPTGDLIVIRDARGEIVAAQIEELPRLDVVAYITPAHPEHSIHRVSGAPEELLHRVHPAEFPKLVMDHINSSDARVAETSTEDLYTFYSFLTPRSTPR